GTGLVLAAHLGDCAERTEPVAPLGDLEVGVVTRGDPHPGGVFESPDGGRAEDAPLLALLGDGPIDDADDLLAAEHADDLIDLGDGFEEHFLLPLGQATGDDDGPDLPAAL